MKTKVALECVRMIVSGGKMVKLMTHQETHTHTHTRSKKIQENQLSSEGECFTGTGS